MKQLIDEINQIDIKTILSRYGAGFNKFNKAICPFHNDNKPSLSIKDNRWRCFTCNLGGDGIDYAQKLYNLDFKEAVNKLAFDFHLSPRQTKTRKHEKSQYIINQKLNKNFDLMCHDEFCQLIKLKRENIYYLEHFKPKNEDSKPSNTWLYVLSRISNIQQDIDIFIYGNFEDKAGYFINKL